MARHDASIVAPSGDSLRSFPLPGDHWEAIVRTLGLSDQLARVVELVLCGLGDKQIAAEMGLGLGTVKDYLARIGRQTGTSGRVQLVVRVLSVSHELLTAPLSSDRTASARLAAD